MLVTSTPCFPSRFRQREQSINLKLIVERERNATKEVEEECGEGEAKESGG